MTFLLELPFWILGGAVVLMAVALISRQYTKWSERAAAEKKFREDLCQEIGRVLDVTDRQIENGSQMEYEAKFLYLLVCSFDSNDAQLILNWYKEQKRTYNLISTANETFLRYISSRKGRERLESLREKSLVYAAGKEQLNIEFYSKQFCLEVPETEVV